MTMMRFVAGFAASALLGQTALADLNCRFLTCLGAASCKASKDTLLEVKVTGSESAAFVEIPPFGPTPVTAVEKQGYVLFLINPSADEWQVLTYSPNGSAHLTMGGPTFLRPAPSFGGHCNGALMP